MTVYKHEVENTTPAAIRELAEQTRRNIKLEESKLAHADHAAHGEINDRIREYTVRLSRLESYARDLDREIRLNSNLSCPGVIRNDQD